MSDLRNVSLELQRMQREMKKKEAEYHRRKAEPLVVIMFQTALANDDFCKEIVGYGRDEIRVIAKYLSENFETVIDGCRPELERLQEKKAMRAAKRKANAKAKEQQSMTMETSSYEDDEDNWNSGNAEEQFPDAEHDPRVQQYKGY